MGAGTKNRATGFAALAVTALAATSVFAVAPAAHAEWVSPETILEGDIWSDWGVWTGSDGETSPEFTQCSIVLPAEDEEAGNAIEYYIPLDSQPTTAAELADFLESLSVSMPTGGTVSLGVLTDFWEGGEGGGSGTAADVVIPILSGATTLTLDTVGEFWASAALGLPDSGELGLLVDALDGYEIQTFTIMLSSYEPFELQWIAIGGETHWFGTDAEWFLNDPTCGTGPAPTPTPNPTPGPAPTAPVLVDTAVRG